MEGQKESKALRKVLVTAMQQESASTQKDQNREVRRPEQRVYLEKDQCDVCRRKGYLKREYPKRRNQGKPSSQSPPWWSVKPDGAMAFPWTLMSRWQLRKEGYHFSGRQGL